MGMRRRKEAEDFRCWCTSKIGRHENCKGTKGTTGMQKNAEQCRTMQNKMLKIGRMGRSELAQPFHLVSREARGTAGLEGGSLADEGWGRLE